MDMSKNVNRVRVGFIGGGAMAEAILAALARAGQVRADAMAVSDSSPARRRALKRDYTAAVLPDNSAVARAAAVLFLAVKPQQLGAVLDEIAPVLAARTLVISIAAGKTLAFLEDRLPGARVIRVMPNLPAQVGDGMSVFCAGRRARPADRKTARALLGSFGRVLELPEARFDAVTALSGSGPAFFAYLLDALAEGGVAEGLSRKDALVLAEQTMLGTARLLMERGTDPRDLIEAVTSAKGTTAAGRAVLERSATARTLMRTIRAAARRSRALSRG
jgi:pyrroline-5-carboxylate reductase